MLVNRLWKHHFGEGLVRSPDDFGAMGRKPTHPELLDWLATEFVGGGWSIKPMHRLIVLRPPTGWRASRSGEADRLDPDEHALAPDERPPARGRGDPRRDARLSGRLSPAMYGPAVPVHLTAFMDGRGRPGHSGPLDGDGRRSLYQSVRRNFLNPLILAFDSPAPFTCIGRRNVSNVPAQALTLLNDPLVLQASPPLGRAASRPVPCRDDRARLDTAFLAASAEPPPPTSRGPASTFLGRSGWADLCHVLLNMKELIFID